MLKCVIFDIDGTLAKIGDRSPYDGSKVHLDTVVEPVKTMCNYLGNMGFKVFITTGRMDNFKQNTVDWLSQNGIVYDQLFMRKFPDQRQDSIVKEEMFNENIKDKYEVFCVFDDRPQVVRQRRKLGLYVFDCNQRSFSF